MNELKLPELGEGIESAVVACWNFQEGDRVESGDDVLEVVTDKATFNISAEHSGVLKEICAQKGAEVSVGALLAKIG